MFETPSENFADKCKQNNIWMEHLQPLKSIFIIQKPKFLKILKRSYSLKTVNTERNKDGMSGKPSDSVSNT